MGRGETDVDRFRIGPGVSQQTRVHEMVVQHDVRGREIPKTSHRDEAGIPGTGADQIDDASQGPSVVVDRRLIALACCGVATAFSDSTSTAPGVMQLTCTL